MVSFRDRGVVMREWIIGLGALTLAGCGSSPVPEIFLVGDFEIHLDSERLIIQTSQGQQVFVSPQEGPWLTLGKAKTEVAYGSGSFTFESSQTQACESVVVTPTKWGDGSVSMDAQFDDCDATVRLRFTKAGDHRLHLVATAGSDWNRIGLRGRSEASERFVGFGAQYDGVDMKGRELPIWCQEQGHGRGAEPVTSVLSAGIGNPAGDWHTSYTCVPWAMTNTGRGLALENTERAVFDMREDDVFEAEVWHNNLAAQFIAGSDPATLVQRYTEGFGRMSALPEWTQQGTIIRAHGGSEEVLAKVAQARDAGLPLAAVWVEDWCGLRETALGSRMWWNWSVDRSRYPDWEDLVAQLDADGVAVLAYANPYLTDASEHPGADRHLFEEAKAAGYLVRDLDGEIFWMDQAGFDAAVVDLSNPEAAQWLQGVIEDLIGTGVRGWMADFAEGLPLDVTLHGGSPETWHNAWPEEWAAINDAALEATGLTEDALVFHRSGNQYSPGLARAFWLGDQLVTWDAHDGLASVVPALISSGLSGYSMQHSDTGGYLSVSALGVSRDGELFQRWVELNAMTALVRMHSSNQPDANHQWDTDEETTAHLAQMTQMFASLADYRAGLMDEAETMGWPLVRPLFFHHPEDATAWTIEDQFMLGEDLVMAPVMTQGAVQRELYLPQGRWVHVPTGQITAGPQWLTVDAPIGSPAVFVRAGSAAAAGL